MKKVVAILLVGAAITAGFFFWKQRQEESDKAVAQRERPKTAVIEQRNIRFFVSAAGEIGAAETEAICVRPEVTGRIAILAVDLGDRVKKDDVLFTLDDRDLQIEKSSMEKDIERSRLQLEQAERNYRRSQELYNEHLLSLELFEQTKTEFDLARNALGRTEKSLELVNDKVRKTKIVAPFDCTVLTRPVSVGQAVSGSGGVSGGTEVLTIANLTDLVINAHINQADVARLKEDQVVEVAVEALQGFSLTGRVERIAPQATIKNNIKGFATRILLKDVDPQVRPGMTANIKVPVASAANVVAAPLASVFTELNPDTQQQERFVVVLREGRYERRPVQIGVSDNFFVEVTAGLASGETVALELPKEEYTKIIGSPEALTNQLAAAPRLPGAPAAGNTVTNTRPAPLPGARPRS